MNMGRLLKDFVLAVDRIASAMEKQTFAQEKCVENGRRVAASNERMAMVRVAEWQASIHNTETWCSACAERLAEPTNDKSHPCWQCVIAGGAQPSMFRKARPCTDADGKP